MNETYTLYIDAYTPETIPMARLAEYMQVLASLLRHRKSVHFDCLKPGSTRIVTRIDHEDVPGIRARLGQVRRGDAVGEPAREKTDLDCLLNEDNAKGELRRDAPVAEDEGVVVILGTTRPRSVSYGPFIQDGSLDCDSQPTVKH